jgi:hypothetical protein
LNAYSTVREMDRVKMPTPKAVNSNTQARGLIISQPTDRVKIICRDISQGLPTGKTATALSTPVDRLIYSKVRTVSFLN